MLFTVVCPGLGAMGPESCTDIIAVNQAVDYIMNQPDGMFYE